MWVFFIQLNPLSHFTSIGTLTTEYPVYKVSQSTFANAHERIRVNRKVLYRFVIFVIIEILNIRNVRIRTHQNGYVMGYIIRIIYRHCVRHCASTLYNATNQSPLKWFISEYGPVWCGQSQYSIQRCQDLLLHCRFNPVPSRQCQHC